MVADLNKEIRKLIDMFAVGTHPSVVHVGNGQVYFVPSASELGAFHVVGQIQHTDNGKIMRGWVCSCKAFRFGQGGERCKHIETVQLGTPSKSPSSSKSKRKTAQPHSSRSSQLPVEAKRKASTGKTLKTSASKSKSSRKKTTSRTSKSTKRR